ncbi:MAG: clostripain-related cysteine peptidase [Candidatus Riflebacteria bacterium]
MKKAILTILVLLIAFAAPADLLAKNEWTVIIYMVNDGKSGDALEQANFKNLSRMKYYGAGPNAEIIVQMDGMADGSSDEQKLNYKGASRLRIEKDKIVDEGALGEKNMGDPHTLWECLEWARQKHPANHYALIINSHGSGVFTWSGTGSTSSSNPGEVIFHPDRVAETRRNKILNRVLGSHSGTFQNAVNANGRFVAYDTTDNDALTVFEVAKVLETFNVRHNQKIDLVGFDACMPGSIEVLFELKDACTYMVGSPETTPINGFAYEAMSRMLSRNGMISPEEFAVKMAEDLNDSRIGAWRLSDAQQIAFALNNLAMQLLNAMNETGKSFGLGSASSFGGKDRYWDLLKVANAFAREDSKLNGAANTAVIKQMGKELYDAVINARLTRNGTISLVWPNKDEYKKFRGFYKALKLSKEYKWDEVLDQRELGIK